MIKEICDLLNISRQTYYNWLSEYKVEKSSHHVLLLFVHYLFRNKSEIKNFLDYSFLPILAETNFIDKDYSIRNELKKNKTKRGDILKLLGINNYSNVFKFLDKRPKLEKLLDLIFANKQLPISHMINTIKYYEIDNPNSMIDHNPYNRLDHKRINIFIESLLRFDDIKLSKILIKSFLNAYENKEWSEDFVFLIIKNIETDSLLRNEYIKLINHVNNNFDLNANDFILFKMEIGRNMRQILNYAINYNNSQLINKVTSIFPEMYNEFEFLHKLKS